MNRSEEFFIRMKLGCGDDEEIVVLRQDSPLKKMQALLDAKVNEQLESLSLDGDKTELDAELVKLISWINEKEAQRADLSPAQIKRLEELEEKRQQKELEYEELAELGSANLVSDLRAESYPAGQDPVDERESKGIDRVQVPRSDGNGHLDLFESTDADVLRVILLRQAQTLDAETKAKLQSWIDEQKDKNAGDRIRVFHKGMDYPECSSSVDLTKHGSEYIADLNEQMQAGAYFLPEHRKKLEEFKEERSSETDRDYLEIRTLLPGRYNIVNQNLEVSILQKILLLSIVDKEAKERIDDWLKNRDLRDKENHEQVCVHRLSECSHGQFIDLNDPQFSQKLNDLIRLYDSHIDPKDLSKIDDWYKQHPDLDPGPYLQELLEGENISKKEKLVLLQDQMYGKLNSRVPQVHRILKTLRTHGSELPHESELPELAGEQEKVKESVAYAAGPVANAAGPEEQESKAKDESIEYGGKKYSKKNTLEDLKNLYGDLQEYKPASLEDKDALKLMVWIEEKEKSSGKQEKPYVNPAERAIQEYELKAKEAFASRLQSHLSDLQGNQQTTVDGQYSEQWGADKSALAANAMGAASGGLRPMGLLQFSQILSAAYRENLNKLQLADQLQTNSEALEKLNRERPVDSPPGGSVSGPVSGPLPGSVGGPVGGSVESSAGSSAGGEKTNMDTAEREIHKLGKEKMELVITQLYQAVRDFKDRERARTPNRDNKEIDEYLLPGPGSWAGPGGSGGIGH